ncbi:MAG: ABC transporter permease [Planctomycetota bacterium]|jgi:putative ABC transport system permease protein
MRVTRNVQLGIKNLWRHRMRSMLTMLGVVFGVASVVAMLAVGEGASAQAMDQIRRLGSNNILLSAIKPQEDEAAGQRRSRMSVYGLTYDDDKRLRETMPGVKRTVPVKLVRKEGRLGSLTLNLRVVGTTPDWFALVRRRVIAGRVLSQEDIETFNSVCVLTEHGARRLLATKGSLGESLKIGSDFFEVVGIVASEAGSIDGGIQTPDQQVDVYIPMNVCRQCFGEIVVQRATGSSSRELVPLHQIIIEVKSIEEVEATAQAVDRMLSRFHKKQDYKVSVPLALLRQAEETKRTFNIVLGSIAGISLLVGGIGIMNIMLASVTERTREIGIRRAVGAKRRQIVGQFLVETLVLSVLGGLLGIGLGVAVPWLIETLADMPTRVTPWSVMLAVGISGAVGVLFGLYPAVRAAKVDPIVALRHE